MESESEATESELNESEDQPKEVKQVEEYDPTTVLTAEQIQHFREMFDAFDVHHKYEISTKTIGYVLRLMGLNPTKAEIKNHIREVDPENRGTIDFIAFLTPIAQRIHQVPETYEDIIEAFRVLDEENQEFIETEDLFEYLTTLGEDLEDFEIELLLKMAETKGTGRVNYVQFVEKIMGVGKKEKKKGKKNKKNKK